MYNNDFSLEFLVSSTVRIFRDGALIIFFFVNLQRNRPLFCFYAFVMQRIRVRFKEKNEIRERKERRAEEK
jgi:hypothetical protein